MSKINLRKILSYQPKRWSKTSENYFSLEDVLYLKKLVTFIKGKNFTREELIAAWDTMLAIKASKAHVYPDNRVTLPEALAAFFEDLDYHEVKKHYAAFLEAVNA